METSPFFPAASREWADTLGRHSSADCRQAGLGCLAEEGAKAVLARGWLGGPCPPPPLQGSACVAGVQGQHVPMVALWRQGLGSLCAV